MLLKICHKPIDVLKHPFPELKSFRVKTDVLMVGICAPYIGKDECAWMFVGNAKAINYPHRMLCLLNP